MLFYDKGDLKSAKMRAIPLLVKEKSHRALRKVALKNYYTGRFYYKFYLHRSNSKKKQELLIYQMGKVGSSTILRSLRSYGLDMPIYHIHTLRAENLQNGEKIFKKDYSPVPIPHVVWEGQYLRKQLEKGLKGKKWKIITLIRDPIARNISVFFQWPNMIISKSNGKYNITSKTYDYNIKIKIEDIDMLTHVFLDRAKHDQPLMYFDREFRDILGIDVLSNYFSKSKGYQIYHREKIDVLLIKLESLRDTAQEAFEEFLGIEGLALEDTNIGAKKASGPLYNKFIESIKFPVSYIDWMYTSRYAQHFYTEEEIDMFKKRWGAHH